MNKNQKQIIKKWIHENEFESRFGMYQVIRRPQGERNIYCNNVKTGLINNICKVTVININQYDILESLTEEKGINTLNKPKICLIQTIGNQFINNSSDSLEGMRDMNFIIRSNFSGIHGDSKQRTELRELECIYYPIVTNIRQVDFSPCDQTNLFFFSMILTIPLSDHKLIKNDSMLSKKDFILSLEKLETVFQTAIVKCHKILIFSPYGIDEIDGLPVEDVIKMFNRCILKYGHKFNHIILTIPPQYDKKIFENFNNKIIKPQELTNHIDDKYEALKSHFKLKNLEELEEIE
jgi:hypothetical protein